MIPGSDSGDLGLLVFPVDADLERRLILAQGLYPADRLFAPIPIGDVRED